MFKKWKNAAKILLAFTMVGGLTTGSMLLHTSADAVDENLSVDDFSFSYQDVKESKADTLLPVVAEAVEGTNVFDDTQSTYALPQKGGALLSGQRIGYKNFVLKMSYNPGMINQWSQDRLWFRVWDNPGWCGYCVNFTQTEEGVNKVSIDKSAVTGSTTARTEIVSATIPTDEDGMYDMRLVSSEAKVALFLNETRILSTDQITAGDIGHFQFETWDSKPVVGFPITLTTKVEEKDFLTAQEVEDQEKQNASFLYEEGHFKVDYETLQLNNVDGTAQTEKTVMDFSGVTKIISDANAKAEFRMSSMDNEKIVYFGSDFSKAPAESEKWTNFTLTTKVKMDYSHNDWSWSKIMFRAEDLRTGTDYDMIPGDGAQNNSYLFNMKNNMVWLTKMVDGKESALSAASYSFTKGIYYDVKIIAYDSNLSIFINDEKIMTAIDSSLSSGVCAFCTWQTAYSVKNIEIINTVSEEDKNAEVVKKCSNLDISSDDFSLEDWFMTNNQLKILTVDQNRILRSTVATGQTIALFGDASIGNLWLSEKIRVLNTENDGWKLCLMFRSNGWLVDTYYVEITSTGIKILKDVLQTITTLGSYGKTMEGNTDYKIDITAKEGDINVYLNDILVIETKDDGYATHPYGGKTELGPAGISSWNTGYELRSLSLVPFSGTETVGNGTSDIDKEDPVVSITMNDSYEVESEITITYTATDDKTSTQDLSVAIKVFKGEERITVRNGKFTPTTTGEYKITIIVIDAAGHTVEATKNITVVEKTVNKKSSGCNSSLASMSGILGILGLCAVSVFAKRKYEKQ